MSEKHVSKMWETDFAKQELRAFRDSVRILAEDDITDNEFSLYVEELSFAMALRVMEAWGGMKKMFHEYSRVDNE